LQRFNTEPVLTFPEAPGAKGHPPTPPALESKVLIPYSNQTLMFSRA